MHMSGCVDEKDVKTTRSEAAKEMTAVAALLSFAAARAREVGSVVTADRLEHLIVRIEAEVEELGTCSCLVGAPHECGAPRV